MRGPGAPSKVVDASAVAAVLFAEPRAQEVVDRLGDSPLAAPTLLRYEVASACRKKALLHPELREPLLTALRHLRELGIEEFDVTAADLTGIALEDGTTAYDAAYLWLQRALDAELVTLDEDLARLSRHGS